MKPKPPGRRSGGLFVCIDAAMGIGWEDVCMALTLNPNLFVSSITVCALLTLSGCLGGGGGGFAPRFEERPRILAVYPTDSVGVTGAELKFSATTSVPAQLEWNFGTAGTETGTLPDGTLVTLGAPGDYRVTVRACNTAGCSESFPVHVQVGPERHWVTYDAAESFHIGAPSMTVLEDGTPAIVYSPGPVRLEWIAATTPLPLTAADWTRYVLSPQNPGEYPVLLLRDGRPIVVTQSGIFEASMPKPASAAEWIHHPAQVPPFRMAQIHQGNIVTLADGQSGPAPVVLNVATRAFPESSADWTSVRPFGAAAYGLLRAAGSTLYTLGGDSDLQTMLARTEIPIPNQLSDWELAALPITGVPLGLAASRDQLAVVSGTSSNPEGVEIEMLRTFDVDSLTLGSWERSGVLDRFPNGSPGGFELVNGRWVLVWTEHDVLLRNPGQRTYGLVSSSISPRSPSDWGPLATITSSEAVGPRPGGSLAVLTDATGNSYAAVASNYVTLSRGAPALRFSLYRPVNSNEN